MGARSTAATSLRDEAEIHIHPADLGSLFAVPPLVLGESSTDYDALLSRVTQAVKPADVIEALWVKDVVYLTWEVQRLRRLKASLLMKAGRAALRDVLIKIKDPGILNGVRIFTTPELIRAYVAGDDEAMSVVEAILHERGLSADSLMAQALADKLDEIERMERLIAGADARRNRALAEIERRRDAFARRLRYTVQDVTDVPAQSVG